MGRIIKLMALLAVLVIVVVIVSVLYVAAVAGVDIPVLAGVFRAEGEPISAEVIARGQAVERKIEEAVEDKLAFFLELTDEELTSLLLSKIDPDTQIRDARVTIKEGFVDISGSLNGRIGIPFGGSVDIALVAGDIDIAIRDISVGFLSLPGAAKDELQPLVDKALDLNRSLQDAGATQIQQLIMEDGRVVIVSVQQGGKTVSSVTVDSLQNALSSVENRIAPTPPGADVVPPGRTGGEDGPEIYLALGDSLAANVGAARRQDGYVSRFHSYLERQTGRTLSLLNLGVSGESSISITKRQLPDALAEIERRKNDGDPNTRVSFLTIDLGPNDLLSHLGSEDCQRILRGEAFEENFSQIVASLASALEPGAEFYIMTMYNPFNFGIGIPFETFTNGVAQRMNAVIRAIAEAQGATISDPFDLITAMPPRGLTC